MKKLVFFIESDLASFLIRTDLGTSNTQNEFENKMLTDYNSKEPDDNFRSVSRKRKRLNCSRRSGKFQLLDIVLLLSFCSSKMIWDGSNSFWVGPNHFGQVQIRLLWADFYNWTHRKCFAGPFLATGILKR